MNARLKWLIATPVILFAGLSVVMTFRSLGVRSHQVAAAPYQPAPFNESAAADHLSAAVRFETVISDATAMTQAGDAFVGLHRHLTRVFPRVHSTLTREAVATYSLLYHWSGTDPSLDPILLLAHQDVVPADPTTLTRWTHPPFAGDVADGYIWGRGTLDDKHSLMAILEAAEALLAIGYQPRRGIYIALGHDEEVTPDAHHHQEGAPAIAARLVSRGIHAQFSLDECGVIGGALGVAAPVAFVHINEKGYLSFELSAQAPSGHSAAPPPETALSILARAVDRLRLHPMPAHLDGAFRTQVDSLAAEMPFGWRLIVSNLWLTGPLLVPLFASQPSSDAFIRTTLVTTLFQAGIKENVIPATARAVVNSRVLPGDSLEGTLAHIRAAIDDPRVTLRPLHDWAPPFPDAAVEGPGFRVIARSLRQVFPDTLVTPGLCMARTDSRYYAAITPDRYRAAPIPFDRTDDARVHGIDERVSLNAYSALIRFYAQLLRNATY